MTCRKTLSSITPSSIIQHDLLAKRLKPAFSSELQPQRAHTHTYTPNPTP